MIGRRHDGVRPQVALALLALANGGATLARALDTTNAQNLTLYQCTITSSSLKLRAQVRASGRAIGHGVRGLFQQKKKSKKKCPKQDSNLQPPDP